MTSAIREFLNEARAHAVQMRDRARLRNAHPGLIVGKGALFYGLDGITFGKQCFIDRGAMINCGTINGKRGYITAGNNVEIGPYSILWGHGGITIGNNVHIGAHVSITAHEALQADPERTEHFAPLDFFTDPVVIEDHVLICSGVVIVPGVRIGHHAMVGAGAVVTRDIPPYALAVGVPARPMRYSLIRPEMEPPPLAEV